MQLIPPKFEESTVAYKFNIQIKLNRLVLSTYEECRMHIDTPQFRDISQVATYDHTTNPNPWCSV